MLFLDSAKSNDIANFFVKSILVQTFAFTAVYDMIMPLKQFENKKKELCSIKPLKI